MSQAHEHLHNHRQVGAQGETLARQWLEARGYTWIAQNVHTRWSELDLVMYDGNTLVFVEVKYRRSERYGSPLEGITASKQRKLRQAAEMYVLKHPHSGPIRFDALGILDCAGSPPVYTHVPNAL